MPRIGKKHHHYQMNCLKEKLKRKNEKRRRVQKNRNIVWQNRFFFRTFAPQEINLTRMGLLGRCGFWSIVAVDSCRQVSCADAPLSLGG